jgi:uncharacterized spore protein YtfJ
VRVLPMVAAPDTLNQVVNMVPDFVNKIGDVITKSKEKKLEK